MKMNSADFLTDICLRRKKREEIALPVAAVQLAEQIANLPKLVI